MFEDKIVEVNDTDNYYVIKQTMYNNNIYLFTNKMIDEETPSEEYYVLRVENNGERLKMIVETNDAVLADLTKIFADALESE